MKKIKAVVLSYDPQIGLAELLVKKYKSLGLSGYFEFLIPINTDKSRFEDNLLDVTYVKCLPDIISTMAALLDKCADDEWVFWAIDDRYPISLDKNLIKSIHHRITSGEFNNINGIKLLPWREQLCANTIDIEGVKFRRQKPVGMMGFWHHQYVKAKVLKDAFINCNIEQLNDIRLFNRYYHKQEALPFLNDIYVPESTLIKLGEPLCVGELTKNGVKELELLNCKVPDYVITDKVFGFYDVGLQLDRAPNAAKHVSLKEVGLE